MTRTAWFHCFAGTAGDMTMGALVHAGANVTEVMAIVRLADVQVAHQGPGLIPEVHGGGEGRGIKFD